MVIKTIEAPLLKKMFLAGVSNIEAKKEYINEEKYQQTNAKIKNIGKILLIVGIIISIIGFIMFKLQKEVAFY